AVYIEDGGANDDDGVVNGVIEDPLSPSTTRLSSVGVGGGSGSVGLIGLAGLLLLLLFALSARRAAARRR
ncbi:MAG: hypothetical protein OXU34_05590, partial [Gammaproteobacteria bacterium]|nr:hypothetical protein [Gammaproteobacteria bacterium]